MSCIELLTRCAGTKNIRSQAVVNVHQLLHVNTGVKVLNRTPKSVEAEFSGTAPDLTTIF